MRPLPTSIRGRLILNLGCALFLLLAMAGYLLERYQEQQLVGLFNRAIFEKARTFTSLIEWEGGWVEFNYQPDMMPEFLPGEEAQYFQIQLEDSVVWTSASMAEEAARFTTADRRQSLPGFIDVDLPDGRPGRLLVMRFMPVFEDDAETLFLPGDEDWLDAIEEAHLHVGPARTLLLLLARERVSLEQQISEARMTLIAALGAVWMLALLIVFALVRHDLLPLSRLADEVQKIDISELDRRMTRDRGLADELRPIVDQLNQLLARLEVAFRREQQFSAHVAHELRTPVTELRTLADVSRRLRETPEKMAPLLDDLDGLSGQMESMITGLLALARAESDPLTSEEQRLDLGMWLRKLVAELDGKAAGSIDWRTSPDVILQTRQADLLAMVLRNLIANALQHSPAGSRSGIVWSLDTGEISVEIDNPAPGLQEEDLPKLTERYWKADGSRRQDGHLGVGLSICHALCARMNLTLDFRLERGILVARLGGLVPAPERQSSPG